MRFKSLFFILLCIVALVSCEKDPQPSDQTINIIKEKESLAIAVDSVTIHGEYVYPGIINSMKLRVSQDEHLHGSVDHPIVFDDNSYIVTVTGLEAGTTYYYCYIVDFGSIKDWHSDVYSFTTHSELPMVETLEVLMIDSLMARVKCNVGYDGGAAVTERGVCWNAYGDPTTDDDVLAHAEDGLGEYTCKLTELQPFTKYYVRAYAKNERGTSYGMVLEFVTGVEVNLPTVVTMEVTSVTVTTALCRCNVADDGGGEVYERGACWSTSLHPDIADYVYAHGGGLGDYTVTMMDLEANTQYYVRAYAKNSKGINYGEELSFATKDYLEPPLGAVNGLFTVAENRQVWFSQGNLQYQASIGQWRFAENQYEYIGNDNANIASDCEDWIDLFGWGTSGFDHGADCYQPWSAVTNPDKYWAYGDEGAQLYDRTGKADWGYNDIVGEGEGQWRTMTMAEWDYLLNQRTTPSGIRFAKAQVKGVNGVIVLPDGWSNSVYYLSNVNQAEASFGSNVISREWNFYLSNNGAVFLPAAGKREGTEVSSAGARGFYFSSESDERFAIGVAFDYCGIEEQTLSRGTGQAVRLVRDAAR